MSSIENAAAASGKSILERLARWAAAISGLILAFVVVLTVVDVSLRFAAAPVYGSQEMTELSMVAIIMLAIPLCATTGSDIRVDLFDETLGRRGQWWTNLLAAVVTVIVLGFLVWNTIFKVGDTFSYNDVSNLLLIPLWPFYLLIAIGMGFYIVVAIRNAFVLLKRRSVADE